MQELNRIKFNNDSKPAYAKILFILSVSMFFSSLLTQVYLSNKYAIQGEDIVSYENRKVVLEQEISKLEQESTSLSALSKVEEKAKKLGFEKNNKQLSIVSTPSLASASALQ